MIAYLIEWESFSFESLVKFSEVAGELPEQVRYETPCLFRMIGYEWKNPSNNWGVSQFFSFVLNHSQNNLVDEASLSGDIMW
jgi:hypothetical protein